MQLTNQQIYNYAQNLANLNLHDIKLPVRINFFLQKNIQAIGAAAQEIDAARLSVAKEFGNQVEGSATYQIPPENMADAQRELTDLFNLEQELNIHIFKVDEFENIELTYDQMSALLFMIEE